MAIASILMSLYNISSFLVLKIHLSKIIKIGQQLNYILIIPENYKNASAFV